MKGAIKNATVTREPDGSKISLKIFPLGRVQSVSWDSQCYRLYSSKGLNAKVKVNFDK